MKKLIIISALVLSASRINAQPVTALQPTIPSNTLTANNTAAPQSGITLAIPQSCNTITWITSFGSAPGSVNTNLEFSNDNAVWETADSSILTTGESRTVFSAARFVRATESARSGGSSITVSIVCKGGQIGNVISPVSGNFILTNGQFLAPDGTAGAPSYSFNNERTLGFRRSSAGNVTLQGAFTSTGAFSGLTLSLAAGPTGFINFTGQGYLQPSSNGIWRFQNDALSIGFALKFDALPTVASGFGTSPAITAGSTAFAGSINVGSGAPGTGGVINFNGTAFPSAPFVVCQDDSSLLVVRCTATTTQLTVIAAALTANDVVSWIAVSSK